MPLFHIQDSDRPMFIMAPDYQGAVTAWQTVIKHENPPDEGEPSYDHPDFPVPLPDGIVLVTPDDADVAMTEEYRRMVCQHLTDGSDHHQLLMGLDEEERHL